MKDFNFEYAKAILQKPIAEAEADLNAIRAIKGDAVADAIVSKFSAAMCEIKNKEAYHC